MLTIIAKRVTEFLLPDSTDTQERSLCEYGCELWIYTMISTAGLLLLGVLLNEFWGTIVMIVVFYLCQSYGGGFHASSHFRCFLTMSIAVMSGTFLLHCSFSPSAMFFILCSSIVFLLVIPLILHPNKYYLLSEQITLCKKSRAVTVTIAVVITSFGLLGFWHLFHAGCISMLFSAVSRFSAWISHSKV